MSDLEALYQCLAKSTIPVAPVEEHVPVPQVGTFREKISKTLASYEVTQMKKYMLKGSKVQQMMSADKTTAGSMLTPPRKSAESDLQHTSALEQSHYYDTGTAGCHPVLFTQVGQVISTMGPNLGFSQHDENSNPISHERRVARGNVLGGPRTPQAFAMFMQCINPGDGLIVAVDNYSPTASSIADGLDISRVPALKFWSDAAFLQWKLCATETSKLQYVLRYNVMNEATNFVVDSINAANGTEMAAWPGVAYDAESEEGRALLGTPNGSGVAFMLIQHKEQLGRKKIGKVTVFRKVRAVMILFHVIDV
jgi:hypothetical protein